MSVSSDYVGKKCAWGSCRRRIKATDTFCYQHREMTVSAGGGKPKKADDGIVDLDQIAMERAMYDEAWEADQHLLDPEPDVYYLDGPAAQVDVMATETPISQDAAVAVLDAVGSLQERFGDLTVPQNAGEGLDHGFEPFRDEMADQLGSDRVDVVETVGLTRILPDGRRQHFPEGAHVLVRVDAGTDNEVLVDPFVALYAPVKDMSRPVETAGDDPRIYADVPWVGTMSEYAGLGYMSWDEIRPLDR